MKTPNERQKRRVDSMAVSTKQLQRRRDIAKLKQIRGSLEELIHLVDAQDRLPRTENGHVPTRGAVRVEALQLLNQLRGVLEASPVAKPVVAPPSQRPSRSAVKVASSTPDAAVARVIPLPAARSDQEREKQSAQVQLRLSKTLVRILVQFSKAGQSPNRITERSLWKDPGICDAAKILGITPPQLKKIVSQKAKRSA